MSIGKRDRTRDDADPNAGYPGPVTPDGKLGAGPPNPPSGAQNVPDGDASGRPGSATHAVPNADKAAADKAAAKSDPDALPPLSPGRVRVKAKKTVLVDGMAYTEGQVFVMDEKDFDNRQNRDEFEKVD